MMILQKNPKLQLKRPILKRRKCDLFMLLLFRMGRGQFVTHSTAVPHGNLMPSSCLHPWAFSRSELAATDLVHANFLIFVTNPKWLL